MIGDDSTTSSVTDEHRVGPVAVAGAAAAAARVGRIEQGHEPPVVDGQHRVHGDQAVRHGIVAVQSAGGPRRGVLDRHGDLDDRAIARSGRLAAIRTRPVNRLRDAARSDRRPCRRRRRAARSTGATGKGERLDPWTVPSRQQAAGVTSTICSTASSQSTCTRPSTSRSVDGLESSAVDARRRSTPPALRLQAADPDREGRGRRRGRPGIRCAWTSARSRRPR